MIDDDGSEMIEFPEFLGIIKMGGSKSVSILFFNLTLYNLNNRKAPKLQVKTMA